MDSQAFTTALDKIRGGEGVSIQALTDAEAEALSAYLSARVSDGPLSESDQILCRHIRAVLQERAAQTRAPEARDFQRSNINLRAAIDLFLSRDYGAVLPRDVTLLRETKAKLESMSTGPDFSPNQARLLTLLAECLASYDAWAAPSSAPAPSPAPAPAPAPARGDGPGAPDPATVTAAPDRVLTLDITALLAAAGPRENITEIDEIPVVSSVRIVRLDGPVVFEGNLPDDILVEVRGGPIEVRGSIAGYVLADGDITVQGNVPGGWLCSRSGAIRAGRALSGSVLIARKSAVAVEAAEAPRLIFSSAEFRAEQGVRGGTYYTGDFTASGPVRNARIHLRGSLVAPSLESDPGDESSGILFRLVQSCEDLGRPIPESLHPTLRNFGRLHYRLRMAKALLRYLEAEFLGIQRLRLYALQTAAPDATALIPIRSAGVESALLPLAIVVGEGLKDLLSIGETLGHGLDGGLVSVGMEEVVAALGTIERELKIATRGPVRDRECLEAPGRHVATFAKKLKDTVRLRQGLDKLLFDFDFRLDEWRAHAKMASEELVSHGQTMAQVIGEATWAIDDPANLGALVARAGQQAEEAGRPSRFMQSREAAALREHVTHLAGNRAPWREAVTTLTQEYQSALDALSESVFLAAARGEAQSVRADRISAGFRFQTLGGIRKGSGQEGAMLLTTPAPLAGKTVRVEHLRLFVE